jgi:hypothetical protein
MAGFPRARWWVEEAEGGRLDQLDNLTETGARSRVSGSSRSVEIRITPGPDRFGFRGR